MKTIPTVIICAILSLSIGIAAAAPLLVSELNITPFPRLPDGPKADASISVVYANFEVNPGKEYIEGQQMATQILDYEIILNVTNLSDFGSEITRLGIIAAQDIYATPANVGFLRLIAESDQGGGMCSSTDSVSDDIFPGTNWMSWSSYENGTTIAGGSGLVTGVWLDGAWINVTWIPGTRYSSWPGLPSDQFAENSTVKYYPIKTWSEKWPTTKTVPSLPQNATSEGTWIEGVPIIEMHNITIAQGKTVDVSTVTGIFINGTWVDVTGRVTTPHQELCIRAVNTIAGEKRCFGTEPPCDLTNATDSENQSNLDPENQPLSYPAWMRFVTFTQTGEDQFDNYWEPHQSRLIMLKGTREVQPNLGIESLATGQITLLAEQFNHVQDPTINNTEVYTYSGGHWLNRVALQKTTNGYLYSTLGDQTFVTDRFGEVFLEPRS
ncbi:MAG: hypothetical protein ACQCN3_10860 [Candidatus Bathyarchaeia archaeon]|jgi:hypothetical protein